MNDDLSSVKTSIYIDYYFIYKPIKTNNTYNLPQHMFDIGE